MKNAILFMTVFVIFSCSNSINQAKEKAAIKDLLEKETHYAANADLENWSSCWINTDEASFILTSNIGSQHYYGFKDIMESLGKNARPFDLKLTRNNYRFVFGKDMAFVSYDQSDNWGGGPETKKKETRTLRKVNGEWKIVNTSVVDITSFKKPQSPSFHMQATKLPRHPETGLTNISGLAGMSIGYVDVPAPADFSPLLKGLPHNMCNSPHWGYVIDGSMKVKYADGKEDIFKAGEVFYMPAPHTGSIDKSVKFVDFSPDEEYSVLMDQIAKNIAMAQNSN